MFKKFDELCIKIQRNIGGVIFLVIFTCCLLQVIFRFVLTSVSAPWTEEFSRVGLAYMTFLMAALGIRTNEHCSVDFLMRKLPDRWRFAVKIFTELLIMLVGIILTVYGWQFLMRSLNDLATTYHYSKAWWYWPIPVSGVVMLIYSVRNIYYLILSIIKNEDVTGFAPKEDENLTPIDLDEADKEDDEL